MIPPDRLAASNPSPRRCLAAVRERIAPLTEDRPLYGDIATVADMIAAGSLARAAEAQVGRLA